MPFGVWLVVAALSWVVAYLFAPVEPALFLVPPVLTLAVLAPAAQAMAARPESPLSRTIVVLRRFETPVVLVVFAVVGFTIFGSTWRRGMIIDTGDNQYMMARAQLFYEGLSHGHWQHWTHLWQAGDTLTDLYPIEANLMTALVHAVAPRGTEFGTSYTAFVLFSWWLRGVAVYAVARRFSSPLVAFALGYASLFDVGADVFGGTWYATIFFGMVHNTLSLTFALFAVAFQVDLTRRVTGFRFVACALAVALSACGHALGMLIMVIATFALAVGMWVAKEQRRAGWALAATCLGLALSAIWIIPFSRALAMGNFRVAMPGDTFAQVGKTLFDGMLPTSSFAAFTGLALIAAVAAALSGEVTVVPAGIASVILVCLVVTPFLVSARVLHYFPAFADAQPVRMMAAFKTVVIPCVAWWLDSLEKRVLRSSGSLAVSRVGARTLMLALLLYGPARVALSGLDVLGSDLRELVRTVGPSAERAHTGEDYRRVLGFLKDRRDEDRSSLLWRAAVIWKNTWRHAVWAEGMNTGVPIVDADQVPSNFFEIRPREMNARGFNDWNVRYVLTDLPTVPFGNVVERFVSGPFHVWEVLPFDTRYAIAPPGVQVTDIHLEGESIRFHVEGAPSGGADIQLRTAAFPRWRARERGEWLRVSARLPRADAAPHQEQLVVHAKNGDVLMTCDGTMPGYWSGLIVTLAAALGIGMGASERKRARFEEMLRAALARASSLAAEAGRRGHRWAKPAAMVGAVVVLGLGIGVRFRGARELAGPALVGLGDFDVGSYRNGHVEPCSPTFWRDQFTCTSGNVVVDGWLGTKAAGDDSGEAAALWPGIRVRSRKGNTVVLDFGRVHLDAPDGLWIQNATWFSHRAKITWGDAVLATSTFSGEEMHVFPLPPGKGGSKRLTIELEADNEGSICVLRGGTGKPPPFR
ncbi:MAG TPA: hypothetical protein VH062_18975 [Polyangiaceae bacterium]|nr:hypothetical protein [Polyangiaceae bacterium]